MATTRCAWAWCVVAAGIAWALPGCGASAGEADSVDEALVAKRPIPIGTYVRRSGPSGSFDGRMFDSQAFVVRLTVKAGNKFDADVLLEAKQTSSDDSVQSETIVEQGTLSFYDDSGKKTVYVGDAGTFTYALDGDRLTLGTAIGTPRRVVLERDDTWTPPTTRGLALHCVSANHRSGNPTIDVTLDGNQNQSGHAVVKANGSPTWPKSGRYPLELDRADASDTRHFKGFSSTAHQLLELSFPKAELQRTSGSFEAGGGYSDTPSGFDSYALSVTCTHASD